MPSENVIPSLINNQEGLLMAKAWIPAKAGMTYFRIFHDFRKTS